MRAMNTGSIYNEFLQTNRTIIHTLRYIWLKFSNELECIKEVPC